LHNENHRVFHCSRNSVWAIKFNKLRWEGHETRVAEREEKCERTFRVSRKEGDDLKKLDVGVGNKLKSVADSDPEVSSCGRVENASILSIFFQEIMNQSSSIFKGSNINHNE
jgi:hypothetical protein